MVFGNVCSTYQVGKTSVYEMSSNARMTNSVAAVKLEHQQKSTIKVKAVWFRRFDSKRILRVLERALDKAADTGGGTKRNFLQQRNHQPTKRHLQAGAPAEEAFLSMKTANATNAISNRSNGREAEKML
jgi:hypothetical protein